MRFVFLVCAALFVAACGGEEKKVYKNNSSDDGKSELRVLIDGYPGQATITHNGRQKEIQGDKVVSLGKYTEGKNFYVRLSSWNQAYYCTNQVISGVLVDPEHTVVFFCSRSTEIIRPSISSISYQENPPLQERWNIDINAASPSADYPITGYRIEPLSTPDGGSITHLTRDSASNTQAVRFSEYGQYSFNLYAYSDVAESFPHKVTVDVKNYPPTVASGSLKPSPAFTETDLVVDTEIRDDQINSVSKSYEWYVNGNRVTGESGPGLSSGNFAKSDEVSAFVNLDDGEHQVRSGPFSTTIQDSPATLDLSAVPDEISRGTPVDVALNVHDPDSEPVDAELKYGPGGMEVSNNRLQWHGDPVLASGQGSFRLSVMLNGNPDNSYQKTIKVTEQSRRTYTIADNNIGANTFDNASMYKDVDSDDRVEILMLNSTYDGPGALQILEYGQTIKNEWGSVLEESGTWEVSSAAFMDKSAVAHIALYHAGKLSVIDYKKNSIVRSKEAADLNAESLHYVASDGTGRSLLVAVSDIDHNVKQVVAYDPATLEKVWSSLKGDIGGSAVVENLDQDAAPEMVTEKGFVFDLSDGSNQWISNDIGDKYLPELMALHSSVSGYSRVVMRSGNRAIKVIDVPAREVTELSVSEVSFSMNSLETGDFDADTDDELVVTEDRNYYIYEVSSSLTLKQTHSLSKRLGVQTSIDLAGNSREEIIGVSLNPYSMDPGADSPSWAEAQYETCRHRGDYSLAGKALVDGEKRVVHAIDCESNGRALAGLSHKASRFAHLRVSNALGGGAALVATLDGDSAPELATASGGDSVLHELPSGGLVWEYNALNRAKLLRSFDADNDGVKELAVGEKEQVTLVDFYEQRVLAQTPVSTLGSSHDSSDLHGVEVANLYSGSEQHLVKATGSGVHTYSYDSSGFSLANEVAIHEVSDIAVQDVDSDPEMEIVVSHTGDKSGDPALTVLAADLSVQSTTSMPARVMDVIRGKATSRAGNHLMGLSRGGRLVEVSIGSGAFTWKGPRLAGGRQRAGNDAIQWSVLNGTPHLSLVTGGAVVTAW